MRRPGVLAMRATVAPADLADRRAGVSVLAFAMTAPTPSRRPPEASRSRRASGVLAMLRALLYAVPLAWVLGGGCTFFYSSGDHDDDDDDDNVVIISNPVQAPPSTSGELDPALFAIDGGLIEVTPGAGLLVQATALGGLSPTRLWQPERIGDRELAAFAAGVLASNEELLALPVPAAELRYLDTEVADGLATVRFGTGARAGTGAAGGPIVGARFSPAGELVAIERLDGDRTGDLR